MTPSERLTALLVAEAAGEPIDMLTFWGHRPNRDGSVGPGCLSQWWAQPFTVDGVSYPTAEHWMMASKARIFHDDAGLAGIIGSREGLLGRLDQHGMIRPVRAPVRSGTNR